MPQSYRTVVKEGRSEVVEKKSRFLGLAVPVADEDEAMAFLERIRRQHYDARHNCWAYVLGDDGGNVRASDDGEPSGTAGRPILEVIRHAELTYTCVVVTRYFGGTLLGTGGLVRAYTQAAEEAVSQAETAERIRSVRIIVTADYSDSGKLQYLFSGSDVRSEGSDYGQNVTIRLLCAAENEQRIIRQITELTAARARIEREEAGYV